MNQYFFAQIMWDVDNYLISIGGINLRYYSLFFVLAFYLGLKLMEKIYALEKIDGKKTESLFIYVLVGTFLGARLGHVFFYDWDYYKMHLLEIFLPVAFNPFRFIGFQGLASHGAAVGIIIAMYLYDKKILKKGVLWILDRLVIVVALGGGFVRLGNLMNSEIVGSLTKVSWGFQFVRATYLPDPFLARHPVQIYESLSYFFIFFLLWRWYKMDGLYRNRGFLFGSFLVLVFGARFILEFFKMNQASFMEGSPILMGQILSIPFILLGIYFILKSKNVSV